MQAATNVCVRDHMYDKRRKASGRSSRANTGYLKVPDEVIELIKEDDSKTTYSGGIIAVAVILFILGLIALATYYTMPNVPEEKILTPLTFNKLFEFQTIQEAFEFQYYPFGNNDFVVYKNSTKQYYRTRITPPNYGYTEILVNVSQYQPGMKISPDLSCWLIKKKTRRNNANEDESTFGIMEMKNNRPRLTPMNVAGLTNQYHYMTSMEWGPKDKYVVSVYQNNVYYSVSPLMSTIDKGMQRFICLTCLLPQGTHIYGRMIGYYKESIFPNSNAYWWNKDGSYLAIFAMPNEVDKTVEVEYFDHDNVYSQFKNVTYSFAGKTPNLYKAVVYVTNTHTKEIKKIDIESFAVNIEYYLISVKWLDNFQILLGLLSRDQNRAFIIICQIGENIRCSQIFTQHLPRGWINIQDYQDILYDPHKNRLIMAIPPSDTFNVDRQLYIVDTKVLSKKWISYEDDIRIKDLKYFDTNTRLIYYLAINKTSNQLHLYQIHIDTIKSKCLTSSNCTLNQAQFLDQSSLFIHSCLGPEPTTFHLYNLQITIPPIKLESNTQLIDYLFNISLPTIEYYNIPLESTNKKYKIFSKIHNPGHLNTDHVIKYPVILLLPDKPFQQNVLADFTISYIDYLVSFLHYVVVELDIRGSSGHGIRFSSSLGSGLGDDDIYDIVNGVKHLIKRFKYMDNSSIGVIGSKYGGYLTLQLMQQQVIKAMPFFRCSVSIDAITDFRYYDSFIAEMYLQTYENNKVNYEKSKLRASSEMQNRELLMLHNMNENAILFQSSSRFIQEMIEHNYPYDFMPLYRPYIDKNWLKDRYVLQKITGFLVNCINKTSLFYRSFEDKSIYVG